MFLLEIQQDIFGRDGWVGSETPPEEMSRRLAVPRRAAELGGIGGLDDLGTAIRGDS